MSEATKSLKSPDQDQNATEHYSNKSVQIRQASEADVAFIFNSWLKSYRGSQAAVQDTIYYEFQHKAIENLLKTCSVDLACSASDPSQIYGYIVHKTIDGVCVIHYVYVKQIYRKMGLMKLLLSKANVANGGFYTHNTSSAAKIAKKHKFVYNPYLAFGVL